ncbi:MAG: hypothetical protein PHV62_05810 [Sulfuricurvum sp.]|nr:hypothetical protein [Sulfuricurvum sp.]
MRKDYDIVGSYDNQRVSTINAERTVNMFEYMDADGKRPKVMLSTAGLVNANLNFGAELGGARATFVFNNAIYQVYGGSVFRTTGSTGLLSTTLIGNLTTTEGFVGIDANQYQVIFVDGEEGFIWDTHANTFTKITDTGFPANPIDVCFLDGFFLVANGGTDTFQLCLINQGMVWSAGTATFTADAATDIITLSGSNANFATGVPITVSTSGTLPNPLIAATTYYVIRIGLGVANPGTIKLATTYENAIAGIAINLTTNGVATNTILVSGQLQLGSITSHPGTIVACRTLHRRIFLFSQNYTEVWENAGLGTNLPFRRNNSLLMEVGTPALGSVSVGFDRMFFLAQDKDGLAGVMEVKGTESILVSNRALDFQLAQYAADPDTGVADCRGILVKENGIIFYRMNFTLANHTFVLNVTMSTQDTPKWHEEEVLNGDRHPAQTHAYFDGVNYYGDYNAPKFYIVDSQEPTNDGETIRRMRIGKQMSPEGYNRLRIDRFQIDVLQGAKEIDEFITAILLSEDTDPILTESGLDLLLDQDIAFSGVQPTVFLTISKDGGQTYGNYLHATMGKIGERTHRTVWRKIGTTPRGQGFVPKIEFFNTIPFVVLGAAWDFEVLPE